MWTTACEGAQFAIDLSTFLPVYVTSHCRHGDK